MDALMELNAKIDASIKVQENALAEIGKIEGKTDEASVAKAKELKAVYDAEVESFKGLEAKGAELKKLAERRALRESLAGEAAKAQPNRMPTDSPKPEGAAKDEGMEDRNHERLFRRWFGEEALSHTEHEYLLPKNEGFQMGKGNEHRSTARLPKRLAKMLLGIGGIQRAKALPIGTGDAIGNIVPTEDWQNEIAMLSTEPASLFSRVRRVPAPIGSITYPRLVQTDGSEYGSVSASWIREKTQKPGQEPEFEQVKIETHELAARTELTRRLLGRGGQLLESFLTQDFREAILHEIDVAILNGSGVNQPTGVAQAAGVRQVFRTVAGTIGYNDLVNLEHAVMPYHRANAIFDIVDSGIRDLKLAKDTQQRPLFVPSLTTGAWDRILGYPYITNVDIAIGVTGDAIFGDWSKYVLAMEQDIVMQRSDHRYMDTNVVLFVIFALVGGLPLLPRAFSRLEANIS
jgi:HK97 family phage major capsid protein